MRPICHREEPSREESLWVTACPWTVACSKEVEMTRLSSVVVGRGWGHAQRGCFKEKHMQMWPVATMVNRLIPLSTGGDGAVSSGLGSLALRVVLHQQTHILSCRKCLEVCSIVECLPRWPASLCHCSEGPRVAEMPLRRPAGWYQKGHRFYKTHLVWVMEDLRMSVTAF